MVTSFASYPRGCAGNKKRPALARAFENINRRLLKQYDLGSLICKRFDETFFYKSFILRVLIGFASIGIGCRLALSYPPALRSCSPITNITS